jgi:hypothetical protein
LGTSWLDVNELSIEDAMEVIWAQLAEAERDSVRNLSWRAWPDEYLRRVSELPTDCDVWRKSKLRPRSEARGEV